MIKTLREGFVFQRDWTGKGERGLRDQMLMPAIFFGAISPGLYITALLTDFIPGLWVSIVLNIAGYGLAHIMYLGRMERFWRGLLNLRHSWISRGLLFNIIFTISSTGYVVLRSMGTVADSDQYMPVIKWISFISSLLFLAYPGFMLSFVKAIPFWHSAVEPLLFFIQGVLGGTAVQLLMGSLFRIDPSVSAGLLKINYLLVITVLLIILSALIIKSLHGEAERASVMYLLGIYRGDGRLFLYGALISGLVIPLALLSLFIFYGGHTAVVTATLYTALILELTGIYFAKYGFIRAGAYPSDTIPKREGV